MQVNTPIAIIKQLNLAGYEAYFVGGCVRDFLLKRPCSDWDITTSALPEQIMAVFSEAEPTGISHGTVTVSFEGFTAEVTTFRSDGVYLDGRHPQEVRFVSSLQEDLVRRDFTVNALAMDGDGRIIDLFHGMEDLRQGVLRCIGIPEVRFREDALRMLRVLRFSAQLGFDIEKKTWEVIREYAPLCQKLSVERMVVEMEKVLLSDRPQMLWTMAECGVLDKVGFCPDGDPAWIADLPKDRVVRWAAVCRHWHNGDLTKLRLDKKTASAAHMAAEVKRPSNRLEWKHVIAAYGKETAHTVSCLYGDETVYQEIVQSGECVQLSDLAVRGSDFPGICGKEIGMLLQNILQHVLEYPEDNNREKILKIFL